MFSKKTELAETACLVALDDKSMPEFYLDYKAACGEENPLSFSTFRDLKPWNCKKLKPQTCVCIYHRKAALFIRALNVGRAQLHNTRKDIPNAIFKERFLQDCGECQHAGSCKCKCRACKTKVLYLSEFMDTLMCPKTEGDYKRYYALPCILKQCKRCGWEKIQGKCPVEKQLLVGKDKEGGADSGSEEEDGELDENSVVEVRLIRTKHVDMAGKSKKVFQEQSVKMELGKLLGEAEEAFKTFPLHEFVANWQGDMYHRCLRDLSEGDDCIIIDFIQNFSCFSDVELQAEFFNKTQVSLLIAMVVRWRRPEEIFVDKEVRLILLLL